MQQQPGIPKNLSEQWPSYGLEPVPQCPVCRSAQRSTLYADLVDSSFFCAPGRWSMKRCGDCGTGYLDPQPSAQTVHLAYRSYYTHSVPASPESAQPARGLRWLKRALGNGYRNARFGSRLQPEIAAGRFIVPLFPTQRRILDRISRYLPRDRGKLLDFGCGNGAFMQHSARLGWQVIGVDVDPQVVAAGRKRGLDIRPGGLDALDGVADSFDAVTASHVIEHVADPKRMLASFFRVLRPGGFIYIDTPNIDSLGHRVFGRNWRDLDAPRHFFVMSWQSAEALLSETGFERIRRHPAFDVFGNNWRRSSLIEAGLDPEDSSLRGIHRPGWGMHLRSRLDWRRAEFITLTARKP